MKKELDKLVIYKSSNINDLKKYIKFDYPYTLDMFKLLKKENKFKQEYYYIKRNKDYAFFSLYENKMNIFTFGKMSLFMKLKVIGYPCSLSNPGYVTNNDEMMFDYIKNIRGAKLVLNVLDNKKYYGYTLGETLPTCIFNVKYKNINEYIDSLRSSYRRRIIKAINNSKDIIVINNNSIDEYDLYLNTYNKSNYKLEMLERGFFDNVSGVNNFNG